MKISNHKIGPSSHHIDTAKSGKSEAAEGLAQEIGAKGPRHGGRPHESANIDVSERAQRMQKARDIATKGLHDVDEAKVARLQKLIDEGKYSVDSKAIADRLVDEHLSIPE
jgi:negative regulator of flagellin synthesis FlgM